jgi:hypothetical protein
VYTQHVPAREVSPSGDACLGGLDTAELRAGEERRAALSPSENGAEGSRGRTSDDGLTTVVVEGVRGRPEEDIFDCMT